MTDRISHDCHGGAYLERDREPQDEHCPACGSTEVSEGHHQGNSVAPECTFKSCDDCGVQWDHQ